ncbi:hypothetical protein [Brucella anthropi]|uniref:hypothetical protein n=1 Tax=Brucella anthropi TaxID=529 RepID=UPI002447467D|nr:hypothetical protein [Brucella anthropi]MDG9793062.1 basic secretory family protein [Brucella anthropi]MDH0580220.1 basic secretory family protein [Brucella anthropi]MDH0816844.1 basic secretory family protein [Brucella anthropi]MDH2083376.1 basic secretory family protein [Brucella anthropi]
MSNKDRVNWCDRGWQPVYFGFCPSKKAWKREMKRLDCKEPYPDTDGRCTTFTNDGKVVVIVTIRDGSENERSITEITGLLVHEATHVWQTIRNDIGEQDPSPEFEAYSMQAIFQGLLTAFQETRGLN